MTVAFELTEVIRGSLGGLLDFLSMARRIEVADASTNSPPRRCQVIEAWASG